MAIPLLMQKSFTDIYDEFLFACSHGDYLSVERLLQNRTIDPNDICKTIGQEKLSPMVIAIEHHHLEVIKLLLDHLPYSDFREVLLLAIYLDLTKIAQLIMEHETFKCFYGTFADWETDTVNTFDESHFAAIRPIELAAQYNRTTILYNFLKRVPHNIECHCNQCKSAGLNDSLRYSQLRLSTYRGLSSDVYLALVSQDPITSAFDLCNDLSKLIENEPNLASEYLFLFNQVSHFTARLLDHIQNQIELESLLTIERLNSAIEDNQQEFIVHTNTQQRLNDILYQNIGFGRSVTFRKQFLASIYYLLIYIPMYIGYYWLPFFFERQCRWYIQQPAIQILLHAISYQIFLFLAILSSIFQSPKISLKTDYPHIFEYYNRLSFTNEHHAYYRKPMISYLKIVVLIWMAGYVYRNISRMIRQRRCLEFLDLFTTILFILYIILFPIATIQVYLEWQFITNIANWKHLEKLHEEDPFSAEYIKLKTKLILNQSFEFIDIQMIADGIFTLIIVCSIIQLCFFLIISEYFGPLLVSLLTMSKTIYRWFIFILIFIFAYETSFLQLFSYYSSDKSYGAIDHHDVNTTKQAIISRSFGNLKSATITVFFSLFGITKNELTQTHIKNLTRSSHDYFLNHFTSLTGSGIYGSFAFVARIILITIIIAYIKRIYKKNNQQILNNWNFARAKLYLTFISKDPDILPVPLNLIPTIRHIRKLFQRNSSLKKLIRKKLSQKKYLRNLNYSTYQYDSPRPLTIDDVMNCIVRRFLTKYHPHDIHSLKRTQQTQYKEELSQIRHCVLDEIQAIKEANQTLNKHMSTVFFQIDQYQHK